VLRRAEEGVALRQLDDLAGVHHRDAVRHLRHDRQVVRDEEQRHAALLLQLEEQLEDLRLDGDVERGGGLVGDQHLGIHRQRPGDHHPLLQAAGKLERILAEAPLGVGYADCLEECNGFLTRILLPCASMSFKNFRNLPAHGKHRIQRGGGLLEDHRHAPAAHRAHGGFGQRHEVDAAEHRTAVGDASGLGQQAHDGKRGHGFAAARFAHQGEALALAQLEVEAIDGADPPAGRIQNRL
jgi:hypothetical protein